MNEDKISLIEEMIQEGKIKKFISWKYDGILKGVTFWHNGTFDYLKNKEIYANKIIWNYLNL